MAIDILPTIAAITGGRLPNLPTTQKRLSFLWESEGDQQELFSFNYRVKRTLWPCRMENGKMFTSTYLIGPWTPRNPGRMDPRE